MARSRTATVVAKTPEQELDRIAAQLREEVVEAERHYRTALQHAIRAGELLTEARALAPSGTWSTWLAVNFDGGAATAATYMRLAKHATEVEHAQTITAAVAMLAPTEPRALNPAPTNDPDPMGDYRRASSALARAIAYAEEWKPSAVQPGYLPVAEFRSRVQQLADIVEAWEGSSTSPRRKRPARQTAAA